MVEVIARLGLAAILTVAAAMKLAQPRRSAAAMSVYGANRPGAQWALWGLAVVAEIALAAGVAAEVEFAAYAASGLMLLFAALMTVAIGAGRAGASCACFGAASRLGWPSVVRNLILAVAFALLPRLPSGSPTTEEWLGLGLIVALAGVAGLTVAVLALAREIGMLRLKLPPSADSALEIPEEGPTLGERVGWEEWTASREATGADLLRLAVFLSEGCHVCRGLEPQVKRFGRDPRLRTEIYDEVGNAPAWLAFDVPGSPYAVAGDGDGTVLAKGSFNTLAQLESILAAAERRRAAWIAAAPE